MTKFKVTSKFKIFAIISAVVILAGMIMGIVGQFVLNGFFNYGDEFAPYKSVIVRYSSAEFKADEVETLCDEVLKPLGPQTVSRADVDNGGEIVYRFSAGSDTAKLDEAVGKLNASLDKQETGLNVASVREYQVKAGGAKAVVYASIAVSAAVVLQFIYFIFRYKLRSALTSLAACLHNVGLFVAIIALTRVPVGADLTVFAALVAFVTMIGCGVFFDRVRKNFNNEKYLKTDRAEVVDISAAESTVVFKAALVLAVGSLLTGVFAAFNLNFGLIFASLAAAIGFLAAGYGCNYFMPALHGRTDALCEKVIKDRKAEKSERGEASAKKEKA